jgi:hypothetical protein
VQTAQQREHSAYTSLQQAVHESDAALALAALGTHTAVAAAAAAARAAATAELQAELLTAQRSADRMAVASEVCVLTAVCYMAYITQYSSILCVAYSHYIAVRYVVCILHRCCMVCVCVHSMFRGL